MEKLEIKQQNKDPQPHQKIEKKIIKAPRNLKINF